MRILTRKKKKMKVIIVSGPTASGKSSLAIDIARAFDGEVISADSRQVYKKMSIFSGATTESEMGGVKHHFVNFLKLDDKFSVDDFVKSSNKIIARLSREAKMLVVAGGSSFYIEALIYKNFLAKVPENMSLRKELELRSCKDLVEILDDFDHDRAENIDRHNKKRIIRSIEICKFLGYFPKNKKEIREDIEVMYIWIDRKKEILKKRIHDNFEKRMNAGLLEEAEAMRGELDSKKINEFGLAYKNLYSFWNGEMNENEFVRLGRQAEYKYSKKQRMYIKKLFNSLPKVVWRDRIFCNKLTLYLVLKVFFFKYFK